MLIIIISTRKELPKGSSFKVTINFLVRYGAIGQKVCVTYPSNLCWDFFISLRFLVTSVSL